MGNLVFKISVIGRTEDGDPFTLEYMYEYNQNINYNQNYHTYTYIHTYIHVYLMMHEYHVASDGFLIHNRKVLL